MARDRLYLVGHQNPFEEYPATVVPICRRAKDDSLVAAYFVNGRSTLVDLHEGTTFSALDKSVAGFDPSAMKVFAINASTIKIYDERNEATALEHLWRGGTFQFANPFLSLPIACLIESGDFVRTSLKQCLAELGPSPEFSDWWYRNTVREYDLSRFGVPSTRNEFVTGCHYLELGCPVDKEQWVRRLCRYFNAANKAVSDDGILQLVIEVSTGSQRRETVWQAEVPDGMSWDQLEEWRASERYYPLWQGPLAIAINPQSPVAEAATEGWYGILARLDHDQSTSWVQGRVDSVVGGVTDALVESISPNSYRQRDVPLLFGGLRERATFAPSDLAIIDAAVNGYEWATDAFVAQELSIRTLLSDLPRDKQPIIVPSSDPATSVPNGAVISQRASNWHIRAALRGLSDLLMTPVATAEMMSTHVRAGDIDLSVRDRVALSRTKYRASERPIATYLVIDTSASMEGEKLASVKIGMATFLGQLSDDRGDLVGLISFASSPRIAVPIGSLVASADDLERAITAIQAGGNTAIHDALTLAITELGPYRSHVRAVMLLTDGKDNSSTVPESTLLQVIATTGVQVFGLAYGNDADVTFLERITSKARGAVFSGSISNVRAIFAHMARHV